MIINRNAGFSGLGTDTFKVEVAGMHTIYCTATDLPPSGLIITLSQSGSASVSVNTPTTSPVQQSLNINHTFNCQGGDLLSVVVSSSAAGDQPPNLIRTSISLRQGL